jgi:hypothetical protein
MPSDSLPAGATVRIVSPGPWHGSVGFVRWIDDGPTCARVLVQGLDQIIPCLCRSFGAHELEILRAPQEDRP